MVKPTRCGPVLWESPTWMNPTKKIIVHLAGTVEYADCISAEGKIPTCNGYPGYDTNPSDGEALVQELWGV